MGTRVAKKRLNVTIVEDNEMIMRLVKQMLNEPGIVVESGGANAAALMDVHAWNDVDVAVVDLLLPGTSGDALLEWLAGEVPHVRRVAMSGSVRRLENANADVPLLKPFFIEELLAALRA